MPNGKPNWTDEARADLRDIIAYIADDNPDAADRMLDRLLNRADSLCGNPFAYRPGRIAGTREMVVHPSYILVYAVDGPTITILRLLHSARDWP